MKFEFDKQTLDNLVVFLNRVDLKGAEVPAFIQIMNTLQNPIQDEDNKST